MVPSSSRSRRYGLPSGKAARATRAVSSGTGRTRRSGSDTERPQEERRRYGVSYYTICPCSLEVNSPAVSLSMKAALLRTGKTKNPLENEGHCIGWRPRPLRIRTLRKLARLRHETASLAIAALTRRGVLRWTPLSRPKIGDPSLHPHQTFVAPAPRYTTTGVSYPND